MITLGIALLGGLGAALRYVVDTVFRERRGSSSASVTLMINAVGSLLAGITIGLALNGTVTALLATGLLGGFTTFSAAALDAFSLLREKKYGRAIWYSVGQLGLSALLALAGAILFLVPPGS